MEKNVQLTVDGQSITGRQDSLLVDVLLDNGTSRMCATCRFWAPFKPATRASYLSTVFTCAHAPQKCLRPWR